VANCCICLRSCKVCWFLSAGFLSVCQIHANNQCTCSVVSCVVSHLQFSCLVAWCLQLICTLVYLHLLLAHTCSLPSDSPDVWCHWSSPDNFTYYKISKPPTATDFKLGFRPLIKYFFCLMFFNNISISFALTFLFNGVFYVDLLYYVAVDVRCCYSLVYRYLKRR
jgi:hypothetical protein